MVRYNVILSRENLTSAQYISTMAMHAVSCACDHQEVVYVFVISIVPVWVGPRRERLGGGRGPGAVAGGPPQVVVSRVYGSKDRIHHHFPARYTGHCAGSPLA